MKFMVTVWLAFFARVKPVSTMAKPSCMNMTRNPATSVQTKLIATVLSATDLATSSIFGGGVAVCASRAAGTASTAAASASVQRDFAVMVLPGSPEATDRIRVRCAAPCAPCSAQLRTASMGPGPASSFRFRMAIERRAPSTGSAAATRKCRLSISRRHFRSAANRRTFVRSAAGPDAIGAHASAPLVRPPPSERATGFDKIVGFPVRDGQIGLLPRRCAAACGVSPPSWCPSSSSAWACASTSPQPRSDRSRASPWFWSAWRAPESW